MEVWRQGRVKPVGGGGKWNRAAEGGTAGGRGRHDGGGGRPMGVWEAATAKWQHVLTHDHATIK